MRTRGHGNARVERGIELLSRSGEHGACWYALGALGWAYAKPGTRQRKAWQRGIAVTGLAYGLNTAVKQAVKRPRPQLEGLPQLTPVVSKLSFPSAHATTSFAAAACYSRALPQATPLFFGAAAFFAVSRPYLGVHYPSDVLAGAALGTVIGRLLRCR
ncbi:MAG TPA: phosphatase PAP2 family protein [Solirubrobacteraceae bacterium]|jgi:membrane-associated phospholipid phosphatase|nr:phosphatase PAP2 family protein [Solirubrobacteraceae bacterium]